MNSARLIRIRFAGVLCMPSPERRNESATMKRVKLVTMMRGRARSTAPSAAGRSGRSRPVNAPSPAGRSAFRSRSGAAVGVGVALRRLRRGDPCEEKKADARRERAASLEDQRLDHHLAHAPVGADRARDPRDPRADAACRSARRSARGRRSADRRGNPRRSRRRARRRVSIAASSNTIDASSLIQTSRGSARLVTTGASAFRCVGPV